MSFSSSTTTNTLALPYLPQEMREAIIISLANELTANSQKLFEDMLSGANDTANYSVFLEENTGLAAVESLLIQMKAATCIDRNTRRHVAPHLQDGLRALSNILDRQAIPLLKFASPFPFAPGCDIEGTRELLGICRGRINQLDANFTEMPDYSTKRTVQAAINDMRTSWIGAHGMRRLRAFQDISMGDDGRHYFKDNYAICILYDTSDVVAREVANNRYFEETGNLIVL